VGINESCEQAGVFEKKVQRTRGDAECECAQSFCVYQIPAAQNTSEIVENCAAGIGA
jgi:hypothetical protein